MDINSFTYAGYNQMLDLLKINGYHFCSFHNWNLYDKAAILRHDIDNDVGKAVIMAHLEQSVGVNSTYFVLLTSDFYNVFSEKTSSNLGEIIKCGHEIGLHFDEAKYFGLSIEETKERILWEANLLGEAVGEQISTVSMHRPSKEILDADIHIPGMINSYGSKYFREIKYISDSRRRWREPVEQIICSGEYNYIQILTHAFWYNEEEKDIHESVREFINNAGKQRYGCLSDNITDLESIMKREQIAGG